MIRKFVEVGDDDGFYDVSEVRKCSDWAIYNNKTGFGLTGVACPDCFPSSKANSKDHNDLVV